METCHICDRSFVNATGLGAHMHHKHGIAGKSATARRVRKPKAKLGVTRAVVAAPPKPDPETAEPNELHLVAPDVKTNGSHEVLAIVFAEVSVGDLAGLFGPAARLKVIGPGLEVRRGGDAITNRP